MIDTPSIISRVTNHYQNSFKIGLTTRKQA